MPHDEFRADEPAQWLANARADLALAKVPLPPGGLYEHLCFHAQQAVEKSIKAVLLKCGVEFPFTHSIQALLDLLPHYIEAGPGVQEAVILTQYAVLARYPGEFEPASEEERRVAIRIAETVLRWAGSVLQSQK